MKRLLPLLALLLAAAAAPAYAQAPPPPEKRISPGVSVAGTDVSNLTMPEAAAKLEPVFAPRLRKAVSVQVAGRRFRLTEKSKAFAFDAAKSARRAYNAGLLIAPGSGARVDVAPFVTVRRGTIKAFTARVDRQVYLAPRNATVRITLKRILRRRSAEGRDLDARALQATLEKIVVDPAAKRVVKPGRTVTKPAINANDLVKRYATVLTIDRSNFRLRVFKRLKLSKSYGIAVGAAGYETPTGLKAITTKQVNPPWSAPNKPWAGLYAGRTVPGGSPENPLKARWLGIANGVGIHGTGDPGSIGSRASHGCIRMTVPDVIDLYPRVPVGTPVLIR